MTHQKNGMTQRLPDNYDVLAPDGSQIRELLVTGRASMVHCTLPPGQASLYCDYEACGYEARKSEDSDLFIADGAGRILKPA